MVKKRVKKEEKEIDISQIKVTHNKFLYWTIMFLLLLIIIILLIAISLASQKKPIVKECLSDSDCMTDSCCHSSSCVSINSEIAKLKNCKNVFCTMECSSPLDCNQGKCGCVDNKCTIVPLNN